MKRTLKCMGIFLLASLTIGPAAASPEFLSYEGRNSVHEGQGGERKTVDGIDFWMRGDPPRRYRVIGALTDERHKTGLWGAIRMSSLESDIAKAARAAGGDAVILDGQGDEVTGVVGSSFGNVSGDYGNGNFGASGSSFGLSRAVKEHNSRYVVIRYLAETAPEDSTIAPTPGAAPTTP